MDDQFEGMMTTSEVAKELKISLQRVRQLLDEGILDGVRIGKGKGGLIYITPESVQKRKDNPVKPGNPNFNTGSSQPKG